MANALYDEGRRAFLGGEIDWLADTIKITLIDAADYTKDLALDDFYDDVAAAARVAESGALSGKTETDGIADAANETWTSVSGDVSEEILIWMDTTVESTSPVIANIDSATGLPVTPNGGDIQVQWDDGANKIFKL